ncbi:hypothetical protein [Actinomadura harenae]|uniref:hypothetical protein n=1 Tax=Actinomadura harenae TaxID=2483351 RepID=UPI0018F48BFF|nr:hypothetical protein [Actinomadura harenae]
MDHDAPLRFPDLDRLRAFGETQADHYVNGFELERGEPYREAVLLDRVVSFAQANGSGSLFGIWLRDDRDDLGSLPVVAYGDEGGLHIVARDFREFLRLLASLPVDCEPDIDWGSFGLRECWDEDDDEEEDEDLKAGNAAFLAWLDAEFGITPADDWEEIVDAAQAEHEAEWAAWVHPLIPDAVYSPIHDLNRLDRFRAPLFKGFANGFRLHGTYDERVRRNRPPLQNPARTDAMAVFGSNDSDTFFALDADGRVLALGKDAGVHVVARDLRAFLRLIAGLTDSEIWCDQDGAGLRPCDPAPARAQYVEWLENTLGLRPAEDPAALLAAARDGR